MSLHILFEDNHLIAVFKPSGVLTQGDSSQDVSLLALTKQWLKEKYQKPGNVFLGLVHRLDKPVAGVVLFAKTSKAAGRVSEQFRLRSTKKTYLAVVEGNPQAGDITLDDKLDWDDAQKRAFCSEQGKSASLTFRVLERASHSALIEIDLHTGRKHQIRAQLSHAGYPIRGDIRYGASSARNDGIALLAKRLCLAHPIKKEEKLVLEVPDEIANLRKWMTS